MLARVDGPRPVEKVSAPFVVYLLSYWKDCPDSYETFTVAKFVAQGDAIAYAIWRAHTIPEGKIQVFEVFGRGKRVYRAG